MLFAALLAAPVHFTFDVAEQRNWVGPAIWTNPMDDWQVGSGELACLRPGPNRNAVVLTADGTQGPRSKAISVDLRLTGQSAPSEERWLGLRLGLKGPMDSYKSAAIFGEGLDVGITTEGRLFLGDVVPDELPEPERYRAMLQEGCTLRVGMDPETIEASMISKGQVVFRVSRPAESGEWDGMASVVSHLPESRAQNGSVAAFDNLTLSGYEPRPERAFGPIFFHQYTVSDGTVRVNAQMPPGAEGAVTLEAENSGRWAPIRQAKVLADPSIAVLNAPSRGLDRFRLRYAFHDSNGTERTAFRYGRVRKEPTGELVLGALTCQWHVGYPHHDLEASLAKHDPDMLFFSGDQLYEGNGGYGVYLGEDFDRQRLSYMRKWLMFGWAFGNLMAERPTVTIPDDHDVFHGNVWGAGGRAVPRDNGGKMSRQDQGGYIMGTRFVNMVQATHAAHLPMPALREASPDGIGYYFTDYRWGGVDWAVLEDRKFKTSPAVALAEHQVRNGWAHGEGFDAKTDSSKPGLELLGPFQEKWLASWASRSARHKAALSQTIFTGLQTLPIDIPDDSQNPRLPIFKAGEYAPNDRIAADMDSNGWPKAKRDIAVDALNQAGALHIAGDQHLGSLIRYSDGRDWGAWAFCTPSIANIWPRRWMPNGGPLGEFEDPFGSRIKVLAVANPVQRGEVPHPLFDRVTGYGIVRFQPDGRKIVECWPRWVADPTAPNAEQYPGWPVTMPAR